MVDAAQIAWIVKNNALALECAPFDLESAFFELGLEVLRVVEHLIGPSEFGVFVFERVEAVRAGRHDALHLVGI